MTDHCLLFTGKTITASGTLSGGIRAKMFSTGSGKSLTQMRTVGTYDADSALGCASSSGYDTTTCSSISGISNFSSTTKFSLVPNSSAPHLTPAEWLSQFTGFNFSAVNLDDDKAF